MQKHLVINGSLIYSQKDHITTTLVIFFLLYIKHRQPYKSCAIQKPRDKMQVMTLAKQMYPFRRDRNSYVLTLKLYTLDVG